MQRLRGWEMCGVRLNESNAFSNSNPCPRSSQDHHIFLLCGQCVCINCVRTCVCVRACVYGIFVPCPTLTFLILGCQSHCLTSEQPCPFLCLANVPCLAAGSMFAPECLQDQCLTAPKYHLPHNRLSPSPALGLEDTCSALPYGPGAPN